MEPLVVPAHPDEGDLVDDLGVAVEVVGGREVAVDPGEEPRDPLGLAGLVLPRIPPHVEKLVRLVREELADDPSELALGLVAFEVVGDGGRGVEPRLEESAEGGEAGDQRAGSRWRASRARLVALA